MFLVGDRSSKKVVTRDRKKSSVVRKRNRSLQSQRKKHRLASEQRYISNKKKLSIAYKTEEKLRNLSRIDWNKEIRPS